MTERISPRLRTMVDALPLREGMRVLEIGCGPGVAARAVQQRIGNGYVLGIDRSNKAIQQAVAMSPDLIASGVLAYRCVAIENFELAIDEAPFDLVFAIRVGALDGRHPELEREALARIRRAIASDGRLFVDGIERGELRKGTAGVRGTA
ncbi:MAG: methyltransferase domain-containing protein [Gemmatimonadaceae bacterium]|nr:methyltransferase domain-containing protein [Gemmatimonadaceae bacterium]